MAIPLGNDLTVMSLFLNSLTVAKSSVNSPSGPAPVGTLTTRGRRTRDALLEAARTVFEDVGFPDARVELITLQAEVSYGTFYRYFESKEDIFRVLSNQLFEDIHRREPHDPKMSPADRLAEVRLRLSRCRPSLRP